MDEFKGKSAIITGASRGIGRAVAQMLASCGCNVAFNYKKSHRMADDLLSELKDKGTQALAFQMDVANFNEAQGMVDSVLDRLGRLDFLINNAGITRDNLLVRMKEGDWDEVIGVNLKGVYNFSKASLKPMIRAKRGRILNITSISGITGMPGQANYSASKAGVIGFTKSLAREVGRVGVTCNALALGLIDTEMTRSLDSGKLDEFKRSIPLGRFGTVEEVALVVNCLLSEAFGYITGQVIRMDGGLAT